MQIIDFYLHISHAAICEDFGTLSYFQTSFVKKPRVCRHKAVNTFTPYLSALDFRILDFGVYFKLGKKSSSKPTWFFFFEFELDFYCLCSLQKSISKSNWFFSFLNLIFWNWKKFEWHSISQKSSGERQGEWYLKYSCLDNHILIEFAFS